MTFDPTTWHMDWFEAGCGHAPCSPQLKTRKPENFPLFLNAGAELMWNPHMWLAFSLQMCILFPSRSLSQQLQNKREALFSCVWEPLWPALLRYAEARSPTCVQGSLLVSLSCSRWQEEVVVSVLSPLMVWTLTIHVCQETCDQLSRGKCC